MFLTVNREGAGLLHVPECLTFADSVYMYIYVYGIL